MSSIFKNNDNNSYIPSAIKEKIISSYQSGISIPHIAKGLNISEFNVRGIITEYVGFSSDVNLLHKKHDIYDREYELALSKRENINKELEKKVKRLYAEGRTIEEIDNLIKHNNQKYLASISDIKRILGIEEENKKISNKNSKGSIENFIENECKVGDKYRVKCTKEFHLDNQIIYEEVTILKKFPHFVSTDKGTFTYNELITGEKLVDDD